jgi:radical SAM protein with 4Fe4S-binding SPASM domain
VTLSLPRLQTLLVEVTPRCNHACLHCYNVWHPGEALSTPYPPGELDTSGMLKLLGKALAETHCTHVTLTGGEPLLRDDLHELVDFLTQRDVRITLISNGHLLDAARVRDLIGRGVGLFELPLLSHTATLHDHLSAAPGAWQAVLRAMALIRSRRGQFVAAFVATRLNIDHLAETIRMAFAMGARAFMLNRFNVGGRGRKHFELLPSAAELHQALRVADAAVVEYGLPIQCSIPIQPCLIDPAEFPCLGFGFCAAGRSHAYYTLDPMGNLRPCNHSDLILGNLLETSFADLIASEPMQHFTQTLPPSCLPCRLYNTCRGGCKAAAQVCYGSLEVEEPFLRLNMQVD